MQPPLAVYGDIFLQKTITITVNGIVINEFVHWTGTAPAVHSGGALLPQVGRPKPRPTPGPPINSFSFRTVPLPCLITIKRCVTRSVISLIKEKKELFRNNFHFIAYLSHFYEKKGKILL